MRLLTVGALCVFTLSAHANVIQYFAGISYYNPSDLFKVKDKEFLLGGTGSYGDLKFTGSVFNFNNNQYNYGTSYSRTYTVLPYGRMAKRLNPKTVIALEVTEPFNSNLNWGNNSITRYAATQNYLHDIDVSPKIAYSLSQKWQIGGGLNFNFLRNNEMNWAFPTGQVSYANLINKSTSFGLGYNLGLTYIINPTNFLGLSYYSRIRQRTEGYSQLSSTISKNLKFSFNMPATSTLNYVHLFNPKWLLNLEVFQSQWQINQYARIYNTAAPSPFSNFVFALKFGTSYAYLAALRHQYTDKLGITLAGMIDDGPERDDLRTIMFPSETQYFLGLVGDYHINKTTSIELLYGQAVSFPSIQNHTMSDAGPIAFTTGKVNIRANILDVKIKVQI